MKKLFTTLMLLSLITPVLAETFFEPMWREFCPSKYENLNTENKYYNINKKYWAQRKSDFEQRLQKCNNLTQEKQEACYQNLRELENQLTKSYDEQMRTKLLQNIMLNAISY